MNKTIKLIGVSLVTWSLATVAHAIGNGMFIGGQVGMTNTHNNTLPVQTGAPGTTVNTSPSTTGVGERLSLGYVFNQYGAWEVGYMHYGAASYNPTGSKLAGTPSSKLMSFEMLGKLMYPFDETFDVFGKAGFSILQQNNSGALQSTTVKGSYTTARPIVAIGGSYYLDQAWVLDLSLSHLLGGGQIKSADFLALGISYHFVDLRCGQFLC